VRVQHATDDAITAHPVTIHDDDDRIRFRFDHTYGRA